jgi:hypothetical protein
MPRLFQGRSPPQLLTEAAPGCLKPPPTRRLRGADPHHSYSLTLSRLLDTTPLPPFLLEPLQTAGPLRSTDVTPLHRYYKPGRVPLAVHRLPGVSGYTASLLRQFLNGARRVSPVA